MSKLEILCAPSAASGERPPLLFVHGAWHGAWCWEENFLDYFAARGWDSTALSLRGHGGSEGQVGLRWTKIADYVDDLREVSLGLPRPPVLVGHSMGGFVVQHALAELDVAGAALLASVPHFGARGAALRLARRSPWAFARANLEMSLYPLVESPESARHAFFSAGLAETDLLRHHERLGDESYRAFLDMLGWNLPKPCPVDFPMLCLAAGDDAIFPPAEEVALAEAWRAEMILLPGLAHDLMLDVAWERAATALAGWLESQSY